MKIHPIPNETAAAMGATHVAEITYADLTAAGATQTLSPIAVKAGMGFQLMLMQLVEAFVSSDATLTSTAITVGDGNSATAYLASTELNVEGTEILFKNGVTASMPAVYSTADTVDVFVTGTSGKLLNTHTAGKLLLWFKAPVATKE